MKRNLKLKQILSTTAVVLGLGAALEVSQAQAATATNTTTTSNSDGSVTVQSTQTQNGQVTAERRTELLPDKNDSAPAEDIYMPVERADANDVDPNDADVANFSITTILIVSIASFAIIGLFVFFSRRSRVIVRR